ncbi:MAG: hypothetical protein IPH30_01990 [Betaproteobacteria bacterium]|nr:hypothetical protein [Betaproteobacteria bacterium]
MISLFASDELGLASELYREAGSAHFVAVKAGACRGGARDILDANLRGRG